MSYGKWGCQEEMFTFSATLTFPCKRAILKSYRLAGDEIETLLFGILLQLLQAGV
jgi:hypothetical protein